MKDEADVIKKRVEKVSCDFAVACPQEVDLTHARKDELSGDSIEGALDGKAEEKIDEILELSVPKLCATLQDGEDDTQCSSEVDRACGINKSDHISESCHESSLFC